jgi:hypothetical protein
MRRWLLKVKYSFTDSGLVENWLNMHMENWFYNTANDLYGYVEQARAVAEYWLKNGKHGEDYNDKNIIYLQGKWDSYVECYTEARG